MKTGKVMSIDVKRERIQHLGLDAIEDYFKINPRNLKPDVLHALHGKARIAMQFEREMGVSKRNVEMSYLRVFKMISQDRHELKSMISKSLPKYLPHNP